MFLDAEEEKILEGEYGETRRQMMEILVALGTVYGAERLIPIRSAQVSGASYKTIGEWGLKWLQSLDARVVVPTVLNPIGMPREQWQELGISEAFASRQNDVLEAYRNLGVKLACTCTPYYLQEMRYGDHLAWAESSAVAYANSVIGARTNREGGPGALAAAIVGKTPFYGLHIVENRRPQVVVDLTRLEIRPEQYGALGYVVGRKVGNRIPLFLGIRPTRDQLKALGAAMAATGAVALFHVDRITPEARVFRYAPDGLDALTVDSDELAALYAEIEVDAVAVGCPHCSADELQAVARLLSGRQVKKPFFVFSSRGVIQANPEAVMAIERTGARVYADTCMVVSPGMERYAAIMVNSGKALAYVPDMCGAVARLGTLEECVEAATT